MKRIAIFCDGTWNRSDAQNPTHVLRIAQAIRPTARDGVTQVVHYLPGVGSGQGVTKVSRFMDKVLGGALGWGLDDRILEAYRALLFTYEPGDQIYIFGFSRGAYTARSLRDDPHGGHSAIQPDRYDPRGDAEVPRARGAKIAPRQRTLYGSTSLHVPRDRDQSQGRGMA